MKIIITLSWSSKFQIRILSKQSVGVFVFLIRWFLSHYPYLMTGLYWEISKDQDLEILFSKNPPLTRFSGLFWEKIWTIIRLTLHSRRKKTKNKIEVCTYCPNLLYLTWIFWQYSSTFSGGGWFKRSLHKKTTEIVWCLESLLFFLVIFQRFSQFA